MKPFAFAAVINGGSSAPAMGTVRIVVSVLPWPSSTVKLNVSVTLSPDCSGSIAEFETYAYDPSENINSEPYDPATGWPTLAALPFTSDTERGRLMSTGWTRSAINP